MNRQRLILFVLVIIFGVAVIWSYSAIPRPKTVSDLAYKPRQETKRVVAATAKPALNADDGTRLKINLLDKESADFNGYHRNIFKPLFVDELKLMKQQATAIKLSASQSAQTTQTLPPSKAEVATLPADPVIIEPESAPLARFTFLGFLKKGAVKTVFLAKENDILLVKKGSKVADRYEVTDISDEALTLTVTDTGDEIVIPLIENQPLAKAK